MVESLSQQTRQALIAPAQPAKPMPGRVAPPCPTRFEDEQTTAHGLKKIKKKKKIERGWIGNRADEDIRQTFAARSRVIHKVCTRMVGRCKGYSVDEATQQGEMEMSWLVVLVRVYPSHSPWGLDRRPLQEWRWAAGKTRRV